MKSERFFSVFLFLIIFVITVSIKSWAQCPSPSQLLTHGYHISINYPHKAEIGNLDEFGVVDLQPFILKVGSYPPVKAIYIDEYCESGVYYFSFDTDNDRYPVNYVMAWHEPCTVKTYRLDQEGNYTSGFQVLVTPPNSNDTGGPTADFLMKYNGTPHAVDWNIFNYPWSSFVSAPVAYSPQAFEVNIQGVDNLNYNSSSEFIADINGGSGNYDIEWSYRELPNGNWTVGIYYDPSIYYTIPWPNGNNYYYYDNEYKYNLIMPSYSVELKVSIYDNEFPIEATSTKIISLNPEPVTFINHIENTENFGELILNENKIDPITSGSSRNLIFGNNYTIRTDELPFIVDWGSTGKTEKHFRWEFNNPNVPPVNALNNSFTFQGSVERTMKSRFQPTDQAIIKTFIDGVEVSGLNLEFKDPWLYFSDENSNWFQYTDFIQYPSPLNLFNNSTNSYGGIFKGQSGPPLWNSPYYSVKSPANIYIPQKGKTHPLYLTDWSYDPSKISLQHPGSSQTAVVFKEADAQLTANLKGHLMSNSTSGISSNSQRKMVRTDNGIYHVMYESMGNVFYTHSLTSNFDGEWAADQLVIDNAKNPAIEYDGNIVKAVCEYYDPAFSTNVDLWLLTFEQQPNGIYENTDSEIFATCTSSYFGSAKPVISYNPAGVALVYRKNSTEGLKVKTKWLLNGIWTWQAESTIPQTDANSINPSIIGETGKIHIAFESLSTIKYKLAYNQGQNWLYYNLITLSTGSGYTTNNYPSISL